MLFLIALLLAALHCFRRCTVPVFILHGSSDAEDLSLRLKSGSMAAALKIRLVHMVQWRTLTGAVLIFWFQEDGKFLQ